MIIESIREFNRTVPFVPYEIFMAGGAHYLSLLTDAERSMATLEAEGLPVSARIILP
jgi:hypothetical protein